MQIITFNGALHRKRHSHADFLHVRFDLVHVLFAKVVYCVPHGYRLENAYPLKKIMIFVHYILLTHLPNYSHGYYSHADWNGWWNHY